MRHQSSDPLDVVILDRFLAGESTPAETAQVQHWLAGDPERTELLDAIDRAGRCTSPPSANEVERWWTAVRERVVNQTPRDVQPFGPSAIRPAWSRIGKYVGAGIATAGVVLFAWIAMLQHEPRESIPTWTTYTTRPGERAEVTLPDGSRIALNVASELDIPTDFGTQGRTVRLRGQAVFTVQHADAAPFTVLAGSTVTRVLGTTFMVRQYANDTSARVTVRDGKVATDLVVLTAYEQADFGPDGRVRVSRADTTQFTFAQGVLSFDWVSLPQVIADLNRWYDVDIQVADPELAEHHIKAVFAAGSRSDLAAILEMALDARVVRQGRQLTLHRR